MTACNFIDLTGKRFGKLTVIEKSGPNKSGNIKWVCKCDCGNTKIVNGSHLRSGHTKSCGCRRISSVSQGHSKERIYVIWIGMHNRCYKPEHDAYKWYGNKGIKVCQEWHTFMNFRKWALNNGYSNSRTIDRINSKLNYCPQNCRWETIKKQANNRSNNLIVNFQGKNFTATEFAEFIGYKQFTVYNRLRLGWTTERIANTPERKRG
ncbi:MAG: hypothetical protein ABF682_04360 [Liquorilactobacillus sp.]|uniref:hypothetical protein n=1 Tax=Liquorilactobacillus TaxID=2767888 RepID=UPI0039ECA7AC